MFEGLSKTIPVPRRSGGWVRQTARGYDDAIPRKSALIGRDHKVVAETFDIQNPGIEFKVHPFIHAGVIHRIDNVAGLIAFWENAVTSSAD